jgi:hypothetical protein
MTESSAPLEAVLATAAREAGVTLSHLAGPARSTALDRARQIAMHVARTYGAGATASAIGRALNRHHTSVLYACEHAPKRLETDPEARALHARILAALDAQDPARPAIPEPAAVPKPAPAVPTMTAPANVDSDLPVEMFSQGGGARRSQRAYLRQQDEAFRAAMLAAGYA